MAKIFVSSTFKDMHFERDALKERLTPRLNERFSSYGERVDFIDLRWGVDTETLETEEGNKKVLRVCLNEIENSKPFIVVLIGNRYGWIPERELIKEEASSKKLSLDDEVISITNLEIEYGVMLGKHNEKALFYFRTIDNIDEMPEGIRETYEVESPAHKEKLEALKKRIRERYGDRVVEYTLHYDTETGQFTGIEELADNVFESISRIIEKDVKAIQTMSSMNRINWTSHRHFESLYKNAYVIPEVFDDGSYSEDLPSEFASNPMPQFELITGASGSGRKTTLALKYAERKRLDLDNVFAFACGISEETGSARDFLAYLKDILRSRVDDPIDGCEGSSQYMAYLLDSYAAGDNPIIYIYILNGNSNILASIRAIEAFQSLESRVAFIMEMDNYLDYPLPYYMRNHHLELGYLCEESKKGIIGAILQQHNKQLPPYVIEEILKKKESSRPLYLSLLVEKLLLFDRNDFQRMFKEGKSSPNAYLLEAVKNSEDDLKGLAKELFVLMEEKIGHEMVHHLIGLLSMKLIISLTKEEIERFFSFFDYPYDELSFSLFTNLVKNLFAIDNDYVYFACDEIREAAKEHVNENYADRMIEWIENDPLFELDLIGIKHVLPELYTRSSLVKRFTDKFLSAIGSAIEGRVDVDDLDSLAELAFFNSALISSLMEKNDFALKFHQEIIRRIQAGTLENVHLYGPSLFPYMISTGEEAVSVKTSLNHYGEVFNLYYEAMENDANNEDLQVILTILVSTASNLHEFSLLCPSLQPLAFERFSALTQDPSFIALQQQLLAGHPNMATTFGFANLVSYYQIFDYFDSLPPQMSQGVSEILHQFAEMASFEVLALDDDALYEEVGSELKMYGRLGTTLGILMAYTLDGGYEEYHEEGLPFVESLFKVYVDWVLSDDLSWLMGVNDLMLYKAIDMFNRYQSEAGLRERFETLNIDLMRLLMVATARKYGLDEPLRVLLNGAANVIYIPFKEEEYYFLPAIVSAIKGKDDKDVLLRALFFISLSNEVLGGDRSDELFFQILSNFLSDYPIKADEDEFDMLELVASFADIYLEDHERGIEETKAFLFRCYELAQDKFTQVDFDGFLAYYEQKKEEEE